MVITESQCVESSVRKHHQDQAFFDASRLMPKWSSIVTSLRQQLHNGEERWKSDMRSLILA